MAHNASTVGELIDNLLKYVGPFPENRNTPVLVYVDNTGDQGHIALGDLGENVIDVPGVY